MTEIDIQTWKRKNHYLYFKDFSNPNYTISANLDITKLYQYVKLNQQSFFASMLYYVMNAINQIPEFRTRIHQDKVVMYDVIHPSYTVLSEEELFHFVNSFYLEDKEAFLNQVDLDIDHAKIHGSLEEDKAKDDLVYISSLPWITFTQVTHAEDINNPISIPKITWGKFYKEKNKVLIPISITCHHALVDGVHIGKFIQIFSNTINHL